MAKLSVITDPTLAPGFRLAGVEVFAVRSAAEARQILLRLLDEGEAGVIAMSDEYLAGLDAALRQRIEAGYKPVVVAIPGGGEAAAEESRRRHIAELIRRAIGIRIAFRPEEEERE
jgi:vacuolar-type H+-ATPase subunit F/Vma7